MRKAIAAAWLVFMLPLAAWAVDGVREISHQGALAGGITPGDAPGYPVTLSQPGSYRLTSDLTQPKTETAVIEVLSEDVSIDLNGFGIQGTNVCTLSTRIESGLVLPDDVTCANTSGARAIAGAADRLEVRNGRITGMAGGGIDAGVGARIADLHISHTGGASLLLDDGATVRNAVLTLSSNSGVNGGSGGSFHQVTSSRHARMGFEALFQCAITNSTASWNATHGYDLRTGCTATNVTASRSSRSGFKLVDALVSQCTAAQNGETGVDGPGGVHACLLENNLGGDIQSTTPLGPNVCDGLPCPVTGP